MTGKLMFVPDTHVVVPREITKEQALAMSIAIDRNAAIQTVYSRGLDLAPQLTTPPVLRWEGAILMCGNRPLIYITHHGFNSTTWRTNDAFPEVHNSESIDLARRAAEKALGFPEGLIIPEV